MSRNYPPKKCRHGRSLATQGGTESYYTLSVLHGSLGFALTLFITFALPAPAKAAQISTEYLIYVCERDANGGEKVTGAHATCQAYISGVIDTYNLYRATGAASKLDFCVPTNAAPADLQTVVLSYLKRNPQHQGFVAAPGVAMAMYEAFPCR